jgi:hypothetical protein
LVLLICDELPVTARVFLLTISLLLSLGYLSAGCDLKRYRRSTTRSPVLSIPIWPRIDHSKSKTRRRADSPPTAIPAEKKDLSGLRVCLKSIQHAILSQLDVYVAEISIRCVSHIPSPFFPLHRSYGEFM